MVPWYRARVEGNGTCLSREYSWEKKKRRRRWWCNVARNTTERKRLISRERAEIPEYVTRWDNTVCVSFWTRVCRQSAPNENRSYFYYEVLRSLPPLPLEWKQMVPSMGNLVRLLPACLSLPSISLWYMRLGYQKNRSNANGKLVATICNYRRYHFHLQRVIIIYWN